MSKARKFFPPAHNCPLLIVGYGNTLRSDDGVGPKAVDAVAAANWPAVQTLSCALLAPELADTISRAEHVVFVDAAVDVPPEVQLRPLSPADSSQIMAHAADPRTLLALARDVFGHAPRAWWLTIPAENLGIGEKLSPLAQAGLETAVNKLREVAIEATQPKTEIRSATEAERERVQRA